MESHGLRCEVMPSQRRPSAAPAMACEENKNTTTERNDDQRSKNRSVEHNSFDNVGDVRRSRCHLDNRADARDKVDGHPIFGCAGRVDINVRELPRRFAPAVVSPSPGAPGRRTS